MKIEDAEKMFAEEHLIEDKNTETKVINRCKYCGELNHSLNENELCEDCKITFGHDSYLEL